VPAIIDNMTVRLADALRQVLPEAHSCAFPRADTTIQECEIDERVDRLGNARRSGKPMAMVTSSIPC